MESFRKSKTSSGKEVLGGKSAESNEELLKVKVEKEENVLHTAKPGSPFVVIKGDASEEDIKEAAIFCAKHSQDWRDNKQDVRVHVFHGKDIFKEKSMSTGTFGIKTFKEVKVKKMDIEKFEKETKK